MTLMRTVESVFTFIFQSSNVFLRHTVYNNTGKFIFMTLLNTNTVQLYINHHCVALLKLWLEIHKLFRICSVDQLSYHNTNHHHYNCSQSQLKEASDTCHVELVYHGIRHWLYWSASPNITLLDQWKLHVSVT